MVLAFTQGERASHEPHRGKGATESVWNSEEGIEYKHFPLQSAKCHLRWPSDKVKDEWKLCLTTNGRAGV